MTQIDKEICQYHVHISTTFLYWKNQYCKNDYTNPKQSTDSMQSLSNYQWHFSELEQNVSQFVWKHKRPQIAKTILRKKKGAGGINLSDFKLY